MNLGYTGAVSHTAVVLSATAAAVTALMLGVWLLSVWRRDASIVDVFWGLGFVLVAWLSYALGGGYPARKLLVCVLATVWGTRLAVYLLWRNWGQGEDYRYRAMRARYGGRFPIVSLYLVFGLQGVLMWLVSLPLQVTQIAPQPAHLTALDAAAATLWATGMFFEAVGDWQLARFKADPVNRGRVMDRGLWRYTRHPNYFGDALVWWALFLTAAATPGGIWVVFSPVIMTALLLRVSGVPLLERKLVKTRPQYAEYARHTSAFIPWFPRRDSQPGGGVVSDGHR